MCRADSAVQIDVWNVCHTTRISNSRDRSRYYRLFLSATFIARRSSWTPRASRGAPSTRGGWGIWDSLSSLPCTLLTTTRRCICSASRHVPCNAVLMRWSCLKKENQREGTQGTRYIRIASTTQPRNSLHFKFILRENFRLVHRIPAHLFLLNGTVMVDRRSYERKPNRCSARVGSMGYHYLFFYGERLLRKWGTSLRPADFQDASVSLKYRS